MAGTMKLLKRAAPQRHKIQRVLITSLSREVLIGDIAMKKLLLVGMLLLPGLLSAMSLDAKNAKTAAAAVDAKHEVLVIEEPRSITQATTLPDANESFTEIRLGEKGTLVIQAGQTLSLHNLVVHGVNSNNLRLADCTSTLVLVDSTLVFNDDYEFSTGSLLVAGKSRFERERGLGERNLSVYLRPEFVLFLGRDNAFKCGDKIRMIDSSKG